MVAHPSPDLYGSDLQLLESVTGFHEHGWTVMVLLPRHGPLEELLVGRGAQVQVVPFPVLSKAQMSPRRLPVLALAMTRSVGTLRRLLASRAADALWVNTLTVPTWLAAARLARVPTVCHVHEAEDSQPWPVRLALAAPLLLAQRLVVNSRAAARSLARSLPLLEGRTTLVYNGIDGPPAPSPLRERQPGSQLRVALVGRLSPRKGSDVALDAVALLRAQGLDVSIDVYGTPFAGYEWFEAQLRARASQPDLVGAVRFHGYVSPVWEAMSSADAVVVPSRVEPFGNVAVEAMLVGRPVVASRVQGLVEIVEEEAGGLLVEPGDAVDLARGLRRLVQDPSLAVRLVSRGAPRAYERFGVQRYRRDVARVLESCLSGRPRRTAHR